VPVFTDGESQDTGYWWCDCPVCGRVGLQFEARADRLPCGCPKSPHGDRGHRGASPIILCALLAAAQARFEHGESA
jgi:hypothetical protein